MIPAMYDPLQGRVSISQLREVRVEDPLHREAVSLEENDLQAFLGGKVVMVTGAGGSIGSELALFTVDRDLRGSWPELDIVPLVGDVGDRERMRGSRRVTW